MAGARRQSLGFTLIELMITVAIVGILASVGLGQYRDYVRRAKLSEVLLEAGTCRTFITEGYASMLQAPQPGTWGCESPTGSSQHTGAVQTSSHGAVRITLASLDAVLDGGHVYLVPLRADGSPMTMPDNLGDRVHQWLCGSDNSVVRKSLPSNCRADTTAQAGADYQ